MAQTVGRSDWEFKVPVINTLRAVMRKGDNIREQTGNLMKEIKTLRKNQRNTIEIKNTLTERKKCHERAIQVDQMWSEKESLIFVMCQQRLAN